jgi:hypothetical protein
MRSPQKYSWLKTHLFSRHDGGTLPEYWIPKHENWPNFASAIAATAGQGFSAADGLLDSCLSYFSLIQPATYRWTTGPQAGQSFIKLSAYYPDPDPARRRTGGLLGYAVQDVLGQINCVDTLATRVDTSIRTGMGSNLAPDDLYCAEGSKDAVNYLTAKRAGYVTQPFFQALADLSDHSPNALSLPDMRSCRAQDMNSCAFLRALNTELQKYDQILTANGLTPAGRTRAITRLLSKFRIPRS